MNIVYAHIRRAMKDVIDYQRELYDYHLDSTTWDDYAIEHAAVCAALLKQFLAEFEENLETAEQKGFGRFKRTHES